MRVSIHVAPRRERRPPVRMHSLYSREFQSTSLPEESDDDARTSPQSVGALEFQSTSLPEESDDITLLLRSFRMFVFQSTSLPEESDDVIDAELDGRAAPVSIHVAPRRERRHCVTSMLSAMHFVSIHVAPRRERRLHRFVQLSPRPWVSIHVAPRRERRLRCTVLFFRRCRFNPRRSPKRATTSYEISRYIAIS